MLLTQPCTQNAYKSDLYYLAILYYGENIRYFNTYHDGLLFGSLSRNEIYYQTDETIKRIDA